MSYDATVTASNWTGSCPLTVKVGDTTISGSSYSTAAAFATAVDSAIEACGANYAAGTDLSGKSVTITLTGVDGTYTSGATFNISVTASVTQVD